MTSDGQPYNRVKYKEIITEQILLGYMTKGGVTYSESDNMTPYERKIALEAMRKVLDDQRQSQEEALSNTNNAKSQTPKSRLTM